MLAGGIAIAVIGPAEEEEEAFHVTLAAPEGAAASGFSTDALSVKQDVPIDLEFDNHVRTTRIREVRHLRLAASPTIH